MTPKALVIGGDAASVRVALDLAGSGVEVTIATESPSLHEADHWRRPGLLEAFNHPGIRLLTDTEVLEVKGKKGAFRVKSLRRPRYVNPEVCTTCGRCERACPVSLLDFASGTVHKAIHLPGSGLKSVPSACLVDKAGVAPCTVACPAGINVQGYVALLSKGRLTEALDLVREAVPFPHILGRVCTHPCESACARGRVDQPIGIASLKRYLADMAPSQHTLIPIDVMAPDSPRRVAIIGSGPAGLTCARDLVRLGHNSTIFEALSKPGGMVAVGMPRFRLPREVREAEINAITNLGVEIRTNTQIGSELTLSDLRDQGYEAIFVAIGAHKNRALDIPGEELEGVIDSIAFLRGINLRQPVRVGYDVVVIGGGYTAIDSARSAIRLHPNRVRLLYRRTAEEMSATAAEILETTEEGVEIEYLVAPVRILGENGKVTGVECQRMELGEPDESGRRSPVPIEGSEYVIPCDAVITAIGQLPDLGMMAGGELCPDDDGQVLIADPLTLETSLPGIFAGGDAVYGPRSMVEAVADGRRAAVSIDRYLRGEDLRSERTLQRPVPVEVDIRKVRVPPGKRRRIPVLPIKRRLKNFEEVETGYTTFMALREAKRCLNCGGCSECMECVRACELEAVDHGMSAAEEVLKAEVIVVSGESPKKFSGEGVYTIPAGDMTNGLVNASAVAGKILSDLGTGRVEGGITSKRMDWRQGLPREGSGFRLGIFLCRCGDGISDTIDVSRVVRHFFRRGDVSYAHEVGYACSEEGAVEIREMARQYELTHIVLAACSCCALDQVCFSCSDRRIECKNRLMGEADADGVCYEFVNIREHCAWVHGKEPEKAFLKAKALIRAGVARVRENVSHRWESLPVTRDVFVIGAGVSCLQAAAALGARGFQVTVLSKDNGTPNKDVAGLLEEGERCGVRYLKGVRLEDVQGTAGRFSLIINQAGRHLDFSAGAIIMDRSFFESPGDLPEAFRTCLVQEEHRDRMITRIPGVFACGGDAKAKKKLAVAEGWAVASRVSELLNRVEIHAVQTQAVVSPPVCRGCGTCVSICKFGAPSLREISPGISISEIDPAMCRGCGTCVAHCPSCAISQNSFSDRQIIDAMEAMLAFA